MGGLGLVTNLDESNTELIVSRIKARYPHHAILTEETSKTQGKSLRIGLPSEYEWILDEVDGSTNLARGGGKVIPVSPDYTVPLALAKNGEVIVCAVDAPAHHQQYYASRGDGAFVEQDGQTERLQVSNPQPQDGFIMSFDASIGLRPARYTAVVSAINNAKVIGKIKPRVLESTALESCRVAAGVYDALLHLNTKKWDVAAGECLVKEAGGMVTWLDVSTILMSNGRKHKELAEIIASSLSQ